MINPHVHLHLQLVLMFRPLAPPILILINYRLSQNLNLLGNSEFNHLTISLTLSLTCGPKLPLNKWGSNKWEFNILKLEIELGIFCSDTMLNYRLFQKLKLLGNCEFNHLTISLTDIIRKNNQSEIWLFLLNSIHFLPHPPPPYLFLLARFEH